MACVENGIGHARPTMPTNPKRAFCPPSSQNRKITEVCSLENLLVRFEEPSSMVRWDSPLFTVLWEDEDVPADDIWKSVTEGSVKAPHAGTQVVRVDILPEVEPGA